MNPYSTLAIAKAVVQRLALSGPLKGLLQVNYFDAPGLIKTTSIVGYGLKPLVKFDGDDTLFKLWKNPDKTVLKSGTGAGLDALRKDYVDFCATKINDLLVAAKMEQGEDKWRINETTKNAVVTPTLVNGFIVCLRRLVEAGQVSAIANYRQSLTGLNGFHFKTYKSSQWKALGDAIHKKYFG